MKRNALRAQIHQERQKAGERIRAMPDGEVGWVIHFLQTDLEALTPSEWQVMAFEVASFVDDMATQYGGLIATESGWGVECLPDGGPSETLPSREEAQEIQRTLLAQLEDLWKKATAAFTFPQLTLIVTLPGAYEERKGSVVVAARRKTKEFEYRFAHLLAEHSGRIRRCQECAHIYLAIRWDQLFCHPRCQARVASRKWRETHIRPKSSKLEPQKKQAKTLPSAERNGGPHGKTVR